MLNVYIHILKLCKKVFLTSIRPFILHLFNSHRLSSFAKADIGQGFKTFIQHAEANALPISVRATLMLYVPIPTDQYAPQFKDLSSSVTWHDNFYFLFYRSAASTVKSVNHEFTSMVNKWWAF